MSRLDLWPYWRNSQASTFNTVERKANMASPTDTKPHAPPLTEPQLLDVAQLDSLFVALADDFELIGPRVVDGVIRYAPIDKSADLPTGWTDQQGPGTYKIDARADQALFGYVNGPDSAKNYLFPSRAPMWTYRDGQFTTSPDKGRPVAIVGLRACDLAAISIQDEVLLNGPFADTHYEGRRADFFIVAVNCTTFGSNCFCTSMGTGPKATSLFDLSLTEVIDDERHRFVVEVGTEAGLAVIQPLNLVAADEAAVSAAEALIDAVAAGITKRLDTRDIDSFLAGQLESPRWATIAERCLACTNCTAACPTCFCTTPVDTTDFDGSATRERTWDSCFSLDYSYMGGEPVRAGGDSRYRQWMTHKLGTWIEQFGTSGCVGCGRCITWCPVGIDITEEMAAMRGASA